MNNLELFQTGQNVGFRVAVGSMLAALLYIFSMFSMILMLPMTFINLILMKEFKKSGIKAIYITNILTLLSIIMWFPDMLWLMIWIFDSSSDCAMAYVAGRLNFDFSLIGLFKIGASSVLCPFFIGLIGIALSSMLIMMEGHLLTSIIILYLYIGAMLFLATISGIMTIMFYRLYSKELDIFPKDLKLLIVGVDNAMG